MFCNGSKFDFFLFSFVSSFLGASCLNYTEKINKNKFSTQTESATTSVKWKNHQVESQGLKS